MNHILAQRAINAKLSKILGNEILYESMQTMMNIEAKHGLYMLAINILECFLINCKIHTLQLAINVLVYQ